MSYPVWIKNSKGKYRVNPIGDGIRLLHRLDNGNWGFRMHDRISDKRIDELLVKHAKLFRYESYQHTSNGTYELRLD
jgi:hypothetical protein